MIHSLRIYKIIPMRKLLVILCSMLFLFACQQEDKTPLLMGTWKGASWTVAGKDSGRKASNVRFEFKNDNTYTAAFEGDKEAGTFRLRGDGKLFTTEKGGAKIEKATKLAKITSDTLIMNMNRAGDNEQLVLVKVK